MDLKMEVYTPGLELVGILEIQRSVIWSEKAFSPGSFSVESLITDESRALLVPENIIWIEGKTAGIIEYIHEEAGQDGPYIVVKGYTLTGILERRILWGRYDLKGTAPDIMRRLVDDCAINPTRGDMEARKIPGLVLADAPGGGGEIRVQKTGGTLLEALKELGETYGVAFGVRFNPAVPQMEFWTRWGQNRSVHQTINEPVFYSTELDDVLSSEYSYSAQEYKNVALVAGEGEGNGRTMVTVENEVEESPDVPTPQPPTTEKYTVTLLVEPAGGGIASGGKTVSSGVNITVTAAPSDGFTFLGWQENGAMVSADAAYTFAVTGNRTLTAAFAAIIPTYTIAASIDPAGSGTATGAGRYKEGESVTLKATATDGYNFTGWQENGQTVSTEAEYTFTVTGDRTLVAVYEEGSKYVAGVDWWEAAMPSKSGWRGVAYGGGKFVAVSASETISAYSSDGINWTKTTTPNSGYCIAYGGDKFVAMVHGTKNVIYSTNGINWFSATAPASGNWTSIAYGDGKFVAVKDASNTAIYSTNGTTWASATLPTSSDWKSVTYGDGKFVAVSYKGVAAYSTNGINWTAATMPSLSKWASVTYGDGKFVAVSYNSTEAAYSTDGITWVATEMPVSTGWWASAYGDGKFVALSYSGTKFSYSEDGIEWVAAELSSLASWASVAYGDGKFVAMAYLNAIVAYSSAKGPEK